eukprot:CAMPEP_0197526280 /NCGR_PEP_ID=MMETSP1318-20131121/17121_1 /TAXON_ID=552666 /ORGANISM="Partenskyella glossopodia, Strain RCC365" /LENGTH=175 /DNA_ID=CAMNT_0043080377 /DNA_START=569 /DNA_END=1096 /DNA_ORIENTATION=-
MKQNRNTHATRCSELLGGGEEKRRKSTTVHCSGCRTPFDSRFMLMLHKKVDCPNGKDANNATRREFLAKSLNITRNGLDSNRGTNNITVALQKGGRSFIAKENVAAALPGTNHYPREITDVDLKNKQVALLHDSYLDPDLNKNLPPRMPRGRPRKDETFRRRLVSAGDDVVLKTI